MRDGRRHGWYAGRAVGLLAALAGGVAPAQTDTPPEELAPEPLPTLRLAEVVVSATRTERTNFSAPYSTETIGGERIFERSYRTATDALRDVPGVLVQKTGLGQGSPYIRGFTGFRNLMLIDGVRLNNSVFREGPNQYWNTVDPWSIERIEVVKGPSSVLYGSDAIGGTVSVFTVSPHSYGEGFGYNALGRFRYATAESSYMGRAQVSVGAGDQFGFIAGVTGKDFGDLEAGQPTGDQPRTGYDEYDVDLKGEWFLDPDVRLVVAHQRVRQNNAPRTHQTIFARPFAGSTIGTDRRQDFDQERELTYVQLHAEALDAPIDAYSLSLSWHRQAETRDRIRSGGQRELEGFEVGTLGAWAQFTSDSPIGVWTYGLELYHDNVNSFSSRSAIQGPVADDATYDLFGAYIQNELAITERLDLVTGGRFTYARADAERVRDPVTGDATSVSDDWSALVGSVRLSYALVPDRLSLFGGVSQGFRAPNLSDLTRFDIARTNEIETPSPGLDPERFLSYEVGVKARSADWAATASYFYTVMDDVIIRTPTGNVIDGANEVGKRNAGDGYVQGVELGASLRFAEGWTLFGNLTWQDGETDAYPTSAAEKVREPVSRLMPLTGQVGLRFDAPEERFWIEGVLLLAARADDLTTSDRADTSRIPPGGTPGYEVVSVRAGWNITRNASLTVALENITDEDYRIHGSGLNEPGRNLVVGLEVRF